MSKSNSSQRTQFIMIFFAFSMGMILSNLIQTQKEKSPIETRSEEILFTYKGSDKTISDLTESDQQILKDLETKKKKVLESAGLHYYFLGLAQKEGLPVTDAANKALNWAEITDDEISQFYEANKNAIQKPFFEVKDQIKKNLELKKIAQLIQSLLETLNKKGDLVILPDR